MRACRPGSRRSSRSSPRRCPIRPTGPRSSSSRRRPRRQLQATIADQAKRLFARLGCRDYARFDFRVAADGEPKLMEVNPNPAWAYDGKLAFMAGFAGIDYPGMLEMIVDAALRRDRPGLSARAVSRAAPQPVPAAPCR